MPSRTDALFPFFPEQKSQTQSAEAGKVKVLKSTSAPPLNCHSGLCRTVWQFTTRHQECLCLQRTGELEFFPCLGFCCCLQIHVNSFYYFSLPTLERARTTRGKARLCHVVDKRRGIQNNGLGWGGGALREGCGKKTKWRGLYLHSSLRPERRRCEARANASIFGAELTAEM